MMEEEGDKMQVSSSEVLVAGRGMVHMIAGIRCTHCYPGPPGGRVVGSVVYVTVGVEVALIPSWRRTVSR